MPIECAKEYTNITGDCDLLNQNCEFKDKYFCEVKTAADSVSTICKGKHGGLLPQGADCNPQEKDTCKAGLRCVFKKCSPYCCPSNHLPCNGGICDVHFGFGKSDDWVMMCSYLPACKLFKEDPIMLCAEGTYCHIGIAEQAYSVCDPPSDNIQEEGGPCTYRNDCKESAICDKKSGEIEGICRHLCDTEKGGLVEEGGCLAERTCEKIKAGIFENLGICRPTE